MELPEDVIQIIKEYSLPITRPDWRTFHRITLRIYKDDFLYILNRSENLRYKKFLTSNNIFTLSMYYKLFGWSLSQYIQ